jgi:hypothetical protein
VEHFGCRENPGVIGLVAFSIMHAS